jgi:hypothetical protein
MTNKTIKPIQSFVGTTLTRIVSCVTLFIVDVWLSLKFQKAGEVSHWTIVLTLLINIAGIVFSFKAAFVWWARFGEKLHGMIALFIFVACYLLIVPFFAFFKLISDFSVHFSSSHRHSYWKERKNSKIDLDYLSRMG